MREPGLSVRLDSRHSLLHRRHNRGIALFISLVLLLMLTIVGVSAVQTTTLEVRMARNEHDSMLAFQAAESALRDGEATLDNLVPVESFVSSGVAGLWTVADMDEPQRWDLPGVWEDGSSRSVVAPTRVSAVSGQRQPRFMIEYLTTLSVAEAGEVDELVGEQLSGGQLSGEQLVSEQLEVFRITARGEGATEQAVARLQSTYGRATASEAQGAGARAGRLSWRELESAY
jgi:type IV pilus assembly protein PilX